MNCYNINFGTFAGINKFDTFIDEFRPVARGGGQEGQLTPLENQRSTFLEPRT